MGIISEIKSDVKKSGANKKKILYCRQDAKVRIRFLSELDDGFSFMFHDSYANSINCICRAEFDEDCPYCEMDKDEIRTRKMYAWSVYNYETKEVEIALFAVNQCTPVNQLITYAENYGTIIDRDYVLIKTGKQQSTQFSVVPQDKNKFRNDKAKPFSKSAMLKILNKAFPADAEEDEDEDEDEKPVKKSKENDSKKSGKKYAAMEDEDIPFAGSKKKKKKDEDEEKSDLLDLEWMQEKLENNDIDEDEFCEYHEIKSLKKIQSKTKKQFKTMVEEYISSLDDDDDDDDDDDEEDED